MQRLAVAGLDRAEILPDDHRGGAGALQGHELQQLTAGKADVHPIGRGPAVWDPEQPGEPHHVVDAKATAADHRGPKDLRERAVPRIAESVRHPGRQAPSLAVGLELIGRRADAEPRREQVLPQPGVGTARVDADREVLDQPGSGPARGIELLGDEELQPRVEVDTIAERGHRPLDRRMVGVPQLGGP